MVSVEIFFGFIINVNLELGYFILGFGDNKEVVSWEDFELFSLIVFGVLVDP